MTAAKVKELATRARLGPRLKRSPRYTGQHAAPRLPGRQARVRLGPFHPTYDSSE